MNYDRQKCRVCYAEIKNNKISKTKILLNRGRKAPSCNFDGSSKIL